MVDTGRTQVALMARYHRWGTSRLLSAVDQLAEDVYRQPCGLYFKSIHGTLNHLLLTDWGIWYPRFAGFPVTNLPLDGEVETDRAILAVRLVAAAERWSELIDGLSDEAMAGKLHYTMTTGQERELDMAAALLHVFNHATHHRAQVTAAISMFGHDYPPLDLPLLVFSEQEA